MQETYSVDPADLSRVCRWNAAGTAFATALPLTT
jgi:hypothetical protein